MSAPLLLSVFPSFAVGGAQSRFTTLANQFGPAWRHAIVSMNGNTEARERLTPGLDVDFPHVDMRKGKLFSNLRQFRGVLRSLRPTAMLTHNFGSIEWAMANYHQIVRHVHVEDGFGPDEQRVQIPRRVVLRRIFLRGCPVVLPSVTLLNIARTRWQLRESDLKYIPNGVDLARFGCSAALQRWPGKGPVIGTVAALRPEKNIARLIRAFGLVNARSPARLVIVGDGEQRAELEALTAELGLAARVHFEGHVAKPDQMLQSFDVFAMSSDTEQMPISLLEAMAASRPAAATDVGDIASMLPDIARPFVTPCDDGALAAAFLTIINNPVLQQKLGRANRAKACEAFSQANMVARWSALLEEPKKQP